MATFEDIIASVLDAQNVGKKLSRPTLPSSKHPGIDIVSPGEKYDDDATQQQKQRKRIPDNKVLRDPPIPPEETNDHNMINPDRSPIQEYWDNENYKDNARYRTSRKA